MRTARDPVKNADLWRELDAQAARHHVKWKWLKGHAGHPENERCDELAAAEIARLRLSPGPAAPGIVPGVPVPQKIRETAEPAQGQLL